MVEPEGDGESVEFSRIWSSLVEFSRMRLGTEPGGKGEGGWTERVACRGEALLWGGARACSFCHDISVVFAAEYTAVVVLGRPFLYSGHL